MKRKGAKARANRRAPERVANLHLLTLPSLVQDHISAYLTIPEQLQLRLVCRSTKSWVDRKSLRLAEHIPNSVIKYLGPSSFRVFNARTIFNVITNVHIDVDTLDAYDDPEMATFLERHALSVKSLRLKRLFVCSSNSKQTFFLESLVNIQKLELDEIWIANADDIITKIPDILRRLKGLKLGSVSVYYEETYTPVEQDVRIPSDRKKVLRWHIWNILDACISLDYLRVPISPKYLFENSFDECFRLLNYIRIRTSGITPRGFRSKPHVMQCDINNFSCCTSSLEVLLIVGARMRIQFLNVNSKIFRRGSSFCIIGTPHYARFDYIQSFISSSLVNRSFEYIQKFTFKASLIQNECIIGRDKGPTLFPNLKEFNIIMDIGCDVHYPSALYSREPNPAGSLQTRNVCLPRADQMLLFFFPDNMPYKHVHTATIEFQDPIFGNQKRVPPERLVSLPKIIACFQNVQTLKLSGWNCKRNTYLMVWSGLPKLQNLTLEYCTTITPSCFIDGNGNPNNPSNFRFLSELKIIALKGLEKMSGVTDCTGLKGTMLDILNRMQMIPFNFLIKTELGCKQVVWIKSHNNPDPFSNTGDNATIVTRSLSKAVKRKYTAISTN